MTPYIEFHLFLTHPFCTMIHAKLQPKKSCGTRPESSHFYLFSLFPNTSAMFTVAFFSISSRTCV